MQSTARASDRMAANISSVSDSFPRPHRRSVPFVTQHTSLSCFAYCNCSLISEISTYTVLDNAFWRLYCYGLLNRFTSSNGRAEKMATIFSSICEMNLVSPPQPCSGRRSHRVEFKFSDNSRLQVFVCERHSLDTPCVERALLASGEFPAGAYLVSTSTQDLNAVRFMSNRLTVAEAK